MLLEEVRQLEVQTTKAEARLEQLRQAGIDVNKWLQKAEKSHGQADRNAVSSSELTPASLCELGTFPLPLMYCLLSCLVNSSSQLMGVSHSCPCPLPSEALRTLTWRHLRSTRLSLGTTL